LIERNRDRKSQNIKKSRSQLGKIAIATYVNEKAISQTEKNRDRNQKIAIAELWEPSLKLTTYDCIFTGSVAAGEK
jgi:hypothetical protein